MVFSSPHRWPGSGGRDRAAGARGSIGGEGPQASPAHLRQQRHRRVDIDTWGVDYVALSGHKAYAPYGSGALVGRRDWLDTAPPYFRAGGASHRVSEDASGAGDVAWAPAPARHEGGTPNAVGAIALAAAASTLAAHRGEAEAREEKIHAIVRDGLASIDGVRIVELFDEQNVADAHLDDGAPRRNASDNVGVTTFTVAGYDPTLVAQVLADEHVERRVRIPMLPGRRSLNLANSASIALYEAWRQLGFPDGV